ncbi:FAD-dependent monooxygenase, partial [Agrococcus sp. HG114]|uniref:FAD-dependent monooxygenase n=1 Tax=Agrococcus sp. HG114 TaxID=2969757 RepID=UPI00215A23A3
GRAVRAEAVAIRSGVALSAGRPLASIPFAPPILALPQHRTEALLRARLGELAPGALRAGTEFVGLEARADRVALDAVHGAGSLAVDAGVLVGADGIRSTVRSLAGIPLRQLRGTAAYAMADAPDTTGAEGVAQLHLEPAGIVESFPLPGGRRRWVARLPSPE